MLKLPNLRRENAPVARGVDGKANTTQANKYAQTGHAEVKPANAPACQCHIVGATCLACRRWDRKIRGIETRRALVRRAVVGC